MTQPVQTIDVLLAEHAALEHQLADPELPSNPAEARSAGRRLARPPPLPATYRQLVSPPDAPATPRDPAASALASADNAPPSTWLIPGPERRGGSASS